MISLVYALLHTVKTAAAIKHIIIVTILVYFMG